MSNTDEWQAWFEKVWEYREETLFPSLFGKLERGIFPIPSGMVTCQFQQEHFDPRWLHQGVLEFGPSGERTSWLYVTSGMSNAWESDSPEPGGSSGLGCEFIFETAQQSDWAVQRLLQVMTFQILLAHGRYPGRSGLSDYDRIPLRGPVDMDQSKLSRLMLTPPAGVPEQCQLESGSFDFYHIVAISEAETEFARLQGGVQLLERLAAEGFFPINDPARKELVLNLE